MIVKCDSCNTEFKIVLCKQTIFNHGVEEFYTKIEVQYFECIKCNRRYNVAYDNKRTKELKSMVRFYRTTGNVRAMKEYQNLLKLETSKVRLYCGV